MGPNHNKLTEDMRKETRVFLCECIQLTKKMGKKISLTSRDTTDKTKTAQAIEDSS